MRSGQRFMCSYCVASAVERAHLGGPEREDGVVGVDHHRVELQPRLVDVDHLVEGRHLLVDGRVGELLGLLLEQLDQRVPALGLGVQPLQLAARRPESSGSPAPACARPRCPCRRRRSRPRARRPSARAARRRSSRRAPRPWPALPPTLRPWARHDRLGLRPPGWPHAPQSSPSRVPRPSVYRQRAPAAWPAPRSSPGPARPSRRFSLLVSLRFWLLAALRLLAGVGARGHRRGRAHFGLARGHRLGPARSAAAPPAVPRAARPSAPRTWRRACARRSSAPGPPERRTPPRARWPRFCVDGFSLPPPCVSRMKACRSSDSGLMRSTWAK